MIIEVIIIWLIFIITEYILIKIEIKQNINLFYVLHIKTISREIIKKMNKEKKKKK